MLVKIRKIFAKVYWIIPFCGLFIIYSCEAGQNIQESADNRAIYDGETLYKGVIQARGSIADLIPEIRNHFKIDQFVTDAEQLKKITRVQDKIIEEIRNIEPRFFQNFKEVMYSGDHLAIQKQLDHASKISLQAFLILPEGRKAIKNFKDMPESLANAIADLNQKLDENDQVDKEKMDEIFDGNGNILSIDPAALAFFAGAIVAMIAAVVLFYVNLTFAVNINGVATATEVVESFEEGSRSLIREQIVHSIAVLLQA